MDIKDKTPAFCYLMSKWYEIYSKENEQNINSQDNSDKCIMSEQIISTEEQKKYLDSIADLSDINQNEKSKIAMVKLFCNPSMLDFDDPNDKNPWIFEKQE